MVYFQSLSMRKVAVALVLFLAIGTASAAFEYRGIAYFLAFKDYDAAAIESDLRDIRALGANWVSLDVALAQDDALDASPYLPYGRAEQRHPVLPYRHRPDLWHRFPSDDEIRDFIEKAHAVGLSVLLKPHVHPLNSGMRIVLPDGSAVDPMLPSTVHPKDVATWFANYTRILTYYVRNFDVDGVCIADELSGLYGYGEEWRRLVAAVRAEKDVPITAAFDWWVVLHHQYRGLLRLVRWLHLEDNLLDDLLRRQGEQVLFEKGAKRRIAVDTFGEYPDWTDALDLVGINFYFPLSDALDPSLEELRRAWHDYPIRTPIGTLHANYAASLQDWAASTGKPLLFTEGGWGKWDGAARFPANWLASRNAPNPDLQARAYRAFFEEVADLAVGVFFWDWAEPAYSPEGGPAEEIVRERFRAAEPDAAR